MVYKSGASTSSEYVDRDEDISEKSHVNDDHKSDDDSTTSSTLSSVATVSSTAVAAASVTAATPSSPPQIRKPSSKCDTNGINFGSKRRLRTSMRLNSLNPDSIPQPPRQQCQQLLPSTEKANKDAVASKSNDNAPSSSSTAVSLAQPKYVPKPIRNRRYTINECSNTTGLQRDIRDVTVPFEAKNTKTDTNVLNECVTKPADATPGLGANAKPKRSFDDLNLLGDRLNCSVSLERLTGIIDTLVYQTNTDNGSNGRSSSSSSSTSTTTTATTTTTSAMDREDGSGNYKILCLYCDRSFSSQKLYGKHLERLHESIPGRRSSARTSNSEPSVAYPGCFYCNPGKASTLSGAELIQLVYHLIDEHRDKYFACKSCMIRYLNREQLQQHLSVEHKVDHNRRGMSTSLSRRQTKKVQSPVGGSDTVSADIAAGTDDGLNADESTASEPSLRSLRLRKSNDASTKVASPTSAPSKPHLLTHEETFLSRLGIAQNRSPRSRKGAKNRRGCSSELFTLETTRASRSGKNSKSVQQNPVSDVVEFNAPPKVSNSKCEPVANVFDEDFYESVNVNVKLNLNRHLDGKLETDGDESGSETPCTAVSANAMTNVPAVRSILVKSPVFAETEIHEATTISAFTAFPTLLTAQQYGADFYTGKAKKPITKHSWKWKWDCVKKYKYVNEGGKIVKKVKQPLAGLRDLSRLDMWTQLTMRTKHETIQRQETGDEDALVSAGDAAREEKRKLIARLNEILDKRVLPQINAEQSDQTIIKIEFAEESAEPEQTQSLPPIEGNGPSCYDNDNGNDCDGHSISQDSSFPASLQLFKRDQDTGAAKTSIILSGEWARPRCYICVGCGARFATVRALEEHKASKHPFVHSTHYEIVGKELIEGDLFRNFYVPSMALQRHTEYNQLPFSSPLAQKIRLEKTFFGGNALCGDDSMDSVTSYTLSFSKSDSMDLDSNSRNSKVSMSSASTVASSPMTPSNSIDDDNADNAVDASTSATLTTVKCSKCDRDCNGTMDLYRHMLDCSSDYAWLLAKKRNHLKYRYFGSRRRRAHRNSSSNSRKMIKPKKERDTTNDGASSSTSKSREPTTPRPRPSDGKHFFKFMPFLFSFYIHHGSSV